MTCFASNPRLTVTYPSSSAILSFVLYCSPALERVLADLRVVASDALCITYSLLRNGQINISPSAFPISGQVSVESSIAAEESEGLYHRHSLVVMRRRPLDFIQLCHAGASCSTCSRDTPIQPRTRICTKMVMRSRSCMIPLHLQMELYSCRGLAHSVTYLNTSAFALYLLPFVIRKALKRSHEIAEGGG